MADVLVREKSMGVNVFLLQVVIVTLVAFKSKKLEDGLPCMETLDRYIQYDI